MDPASREGLIVVPDIRDYQRINAEIVQLLDQGIRHVRLTGVENQRLLCAGLVGSWSATIELEGNPGPELAAGLNAPGLSVICRGSAADGAGSGLIDGQLLILGDSGTCTGVSQRGGNITVAGATAQRAGLNQAGGMLILLGTVQALAGERQSGGTLVVAARSANVQSSRGQRGGRFVRLHDPLLDDEANLLNEALRPIRHWLKSDLLDSKSSS